jgi:hypothetical protein
VAVKPTRRQVKEEDGANMWFPRRRGWPGSCGGEGGAVAELRKTAYERLIRDLRDKLCNYCQLSTLHLPVRTSACEFWLDTGSPTSIDYFSGFAEKGVLSLASSAPQPAFPLEIFSRKVSCGGWKTGDGKQVSMLHDRPEPAAYLYRV